jgi:hypothetical protein
MKCYEIARYKNKTKKENQPKAINVSSQQIIICPSKYCVPIFSLIIAIKPLQETDPKPKTNKCDFKIHG